MQLRGRHILPPLAVVGIGGAIGGYLSWRRKRRARPAEPAREAAALDEIDGIPTGPVELDEVEVVVLDADLAADDEVAEVAALSGLEDADVFVVIEARPEAAVDEGVTDGGRRGRDRS